MARCDTCGNMVVFGGEHWNGMDFCSEECLQVAVTASQAEGVPEDVVLQRATALRNERCPWCGGEGPNDIHSTWSIASLLIITYRSKKEMFGCSSCGFKHKIKYFLFTGLCGWWGIPWGILMTPYFEVLNLIGLFRGMPSGPSEELKEFALKQIAKELRHRGKDEDFELNLP